MLIMWLGGPPGLLQIDPQSIPLTHVFKIGSEITVNYWVIVERHPFPNIVVGSLIPVVKSSFKLIETTS